MSVYGDLRTLSLKDLLRWASMNKKTGVLEVERNAIARRVEFRKGWVGSCSSNEPTAFIGHDLLSRGWISEEQLQQLLTMQRVVRKRLGLLAVEMGVLNRDQMANLVAGRARETVHSLFDWHDAFFRFDEGATLDSDQIEVNLSVEELIEEGRKRSRILDRIRERFESSGVVLARTELDPPADLMEVPFVKRILDAADGQRTIAELLLHARASEFPVLHLLHELFGRGVLRIREIRESPEDGTTLLDRRPLDTAQPLDAPFAPGEVDRVLAEVELPTEFTEGAGADAEIDTALQLIGRREFEPAMALLRAACRRDSNDFVRRLLLRSEESFLEELREDTSFTKRIPVLRRDREFLSGCDFAPEESFLLSLVDGSTDVQSVVWLAPLREIDTLMTLRRLERNNVIELADPVVSPAERQLISSR